MELDFVRWLTEEIAVKGSVAVGIGDDAALVDMPADSQLVVAADMITDRVHFDLTLHAPERIGRKALAVNLSDLAAMAAKPLAAVVTLNLPRMANAAELARRLTEGMQPLAERHVCPIVGGDTNTIDGPLSISVTVLGSVEPNRAWLRSGAQPEDRLLVTGKLGGSIAGHHLDFEPRVDEALQLARNYDVHAAIDLSDGLALDLSRMAEASGVGAIVESELVPISQAAVELARETGQAANPLGDGEDFELLMAVPFDTAEELIAKQPLDCGLTSIGVVIEDETLLQRSGNGVLSPLPIIGYEHR